MLDVAVVGGGAAGCMAAIRLASAGLDVALVQDAVGSGPAIDLLLTSVAAQALRDTPGLQLAAHHAIASVRLRLPGRPVRTIDGVGAFAIRRAVLHDALFFAATTAGVRLRADNATAIARTAWGLEILTRSGDRRCALAI